MASRGLQTILKIVDAWIPQYGDPKDTQLRLVRKYYQFLCSIIVFFFVIFLANSIYLHIYKLALGQALIILSIFLSTWLYRRTKSVTSAVNLILVLSAPAGFFRVYVTGGIDSPILFGWPVISTLALMTLPVAWTLFWTVVQLSISAYFFVIFLNGTELPMSAPESVIGNVRIAMIVTVQIILFASVYFIRKLNDEHRATMKEQSEKITDLVRTLSHDLSSPIMTLKHWIQVAIKKGLDRNNELASLVPTLGEITQRLTEVKNYEAQVAGKLASVHGFEEQDPERELSKQMFRFTIATVSISFSAFAIYYFYIGANVVAALQTAVVTVSLLAWLLYHHSRSLDISGSFILFFGSLSGFLRAKMLGGIHSPAFFVWPLISVFSGILLSRRVAGFWTSVYIGIAIFYDVQERLGVQYTPVVSPLAQAQIKITGLFVVQVLVVSALYYLKKQNRRFSVLTTQQGMKKTELLQTLSRDIGVPLREIKIKLAQYSDEKEIGFAKKAVQACVDIVTNIDQLEKQSFEEMCMDQNQVDLRSTIKEVAFLQQEAMQTKGIQWREDLPIGDVPILVRGDRTGIAYQVLNNLISNAVKFTNRGGSITLRIKDGERGWKILIEDTGIGIPENILGKLFDPRKQTTRLGTSGEKGTGFGMPIVKRFVEQYGGTINVDSRTLDRDPQNHGTQFSIELPKAS